MNSNSYRPDLLILYSWKRSYENNFQIKLKSANIGTYGVADKIIKFQNDFVSVIQDLTDNPIKLGKL